MLKHPPASSTTCYYLLSKYINSASKVIVKKCFTCVKYNRVCKVYIRLGKYSAYVRLGQYCNVYMSKSKFKRLLSKKEKLKVKIKELRETQKVTFKAYKKALENLRVTRARKDQLYQ